MANGFSKVSLGFAEFVAQLIHETFDAILDSQIYQIDKYMGFEKALNTSTSEFAIEYLSDMEVKEHFLSEIGFELKKGQRLNKNQVVVLIDVLSEIDAGQNIKSVLSDTQYNLIHDFFLEKLVLERKNKLKMLVERPELTRLFVDSGEIRTKLNLFFLNEDIEEQPGKTESGFKKMALPETESDALLTPKKKVFQVKKLDLSSPQLSGKFSNIKVKEIVDKETGEKIIIIDKDALRNSELDLRIPTARVIANPISPTSLSSMSSEVILKFRSL